MSVNYIDGELLPRRVVAQLGYALYALAMDRLDYRTTEEDRKSLLVLEHEIASVVRDHGDDIGGNSKTGRASGYWRLCQALDTFGFEQRTHFAGNVLFRLRWLLKDCGFRLNVRTTFGQVFVANERKVAA